MKPRQKNGLARLHILAHKAWQAHAYYEKLDMSDRKVEEAWRRGIIDNHSGQRSSKNLSPEQYEAIMLEFAMTAQDDREIQYWVTAKERRLKHEIHRVLQYLSVARAETTSWSYAQSIMEQMNLPDRMEDVPAENLQDVLIALDTHFRRICDDLGIAPKEFKTAIDSGNEQLRKSLTHLVQEHQKELAFK